MDTGIEKIHQTRPPPTFSNDPMNYEKKCQLTVSCKKAAVASISIAPTTTALIIQATEGLKVDVARLPPPSRSGMTA